MKVVFLMSVCALVCLAALVAAEGNATPREANCQNYISDACTRELIPVCGDDGMTYSNECTLCVQSRKQNKTIMVVKSGGCSDTAP